MRSLVYIRLPGTCSILEQRSKHGDSKSSNTKGFVVLNVFIEVSWSR